MNGIIIAVDVLNTMDSTRDDLFLYRTSFKLSTTLL